MSQKEDLFNKTVQISCPVRDREKYLPYYLDCLYNLDYNKKLITLRFLVNDSTDNSENILLDFKQKHNEEYKDIIIDVWNRGVEADARVLHVRNRIYEHLTALRNKLMRTNNSDFYLSVDSDIMMERDTLKKLILNDREIVAGLIINGYLVEPRNAKQYPNILIQSEEDKNKYNHVGNWRIRERFGERLIEVDFTGAIILIKKEVTKDKNIYYDVHPQGEDLFFCKTAQKRGYKVYCDLSCKATHCMDLNFLNKYVNENWRFK